MPNVLDFVAVPHFEPFEIVVVQGAKVEGMNVVEVSTFDEHVESSAWSHVWVPVDIEQTCAYPEERVVRLPSLNDHARRDTQGLKHSSPTRRLWNYYHFRLAAFCRDGFGRRRRIRHLARNMFVFDISEG